MRKLVLAATAVLALTAPSIGYAQQRPQGQQRAQPVPAQQNARGWGDFQGALRAIAGSRLDRAHSEREKPPQGDPKKQRRRN